MFQRRYWVFLKLKAYLCTIIASSKVAELFIEVSLNPESDEDSYAHLLNTMAKVIADEPGERDQKENFVRDYFADVFPKSQDEALYRLLNWDFSGLRLRSRYRDRRGKRQSVFESLIDQASDTVLVKEAEPERLGADEPKLGSPPLVDDPRKSLDHDLLNRKLFEIREAGKLSENQIQELGKSFPGRTCEILEFVLLNGPQLGVDIARSLNCSPNTVTRTKNLVKDQPEVLLEILGIPIITARFLDEFR